LKTYFDTGILLKLYTGEKESDAVERFVHARGERVFVTDLHLSECVSALKLKVFRRECDEEEAAAGIDLIMEDLKCGVLQVVEVDWNHVWRECRLLSDNFASTTGVRTLDALHVAVARLSSAKEFVTSDCRQADLASRVGLLVIDPTKSVVGK
jgi:predicted nucleic acid-binding protein